MEVELMFTNERISLWNTLKIAKISQKKSAVEVLNHS